MIDSIESLVERTKSGERKAAEALLGAIQNDVFRLSMRMLGLRSEAEDATQEILLQTLTHLSEFRGESAFRTWVFRIAVRYLLRARKGRREEIASFQILESLIEKGDHNPEIPSMPEQEVAVLAEEVRLACTQGMVLSIERDLRVSWVLAEIFELTSEEAAEVLDISAAAHRKRLSRAREQLGAWMGKHCGLVSEARSCRCRRQIPVAIDFGVLDAARLEYAERSAPTRLRIVAEADEIEATANALRSHPEYQAPGALIARIRELIDGGGYRVFDA